MIRAAAIFSAFGSRARSFKSFAPLMSCPHADLRRRPERQCEYHIDTTRDPTHDVMKPSRTYSWTDILCLSWNNIPIKKSGLTLILAEVRYGTFLLCISDSSHSDLIACDVPYLLVDLDKRFFEKNKKYTQYF